MKHTLINKDVLEALKEIPDESVDCITTSPPYYSMRSYRGAETVWGGSSDCKHEWVKQEIYKDNLRFRDPNHKASVGNQKNQQIYSNPNTEASVCLKCGAWKGQLGFEPSYEMYIGHLMLVTKELKRVLKKTGTMFWNMGDSYASSGGPSRHFGYSDPKWAKVRNGSFEEPTAFDQGIEPKSLMMLPERFAIRMIDDGWALRNKLIWYSRNKMPEPVKDRFSRKWEFVYFFTKSKRYYFDLDAIRVPWSDARISDIERAKQKHKGYSGKFSTITASGLKGQPVGNPDKGKNPGDMLSIVTKSHKFIHHAVYPETLVEPLIKAGCPKDGVVLDPFAGSGTTGVVAKKLGRSSILIEISGEYCKIIKERMNWGSGFDIEWAMNNPIEEVMVG